MSPESFDAAAYLKRIGLTEPVETDKQGLQKITRAQGYTIPFENFDILLGRGINLAPEAIFQKLVNQQRGGYCFELNNLLLDALNHFGFEARPLLARVHLRGAPTARTHQLILVRLNGEDWLVDVGFGGGGLLAPIPFVHDTIYEQDGLEFRVVKDPDYDNMLQLKKDGKWINLYSFDLAHTGAADIEMGNYYTSTCPDSFFTFSRIATIPIPGGRIALLDFTLKTNVNGVEEITRLEAGKEYLDALEKHFGIRLDAEYADLKPPQDG